jgi:hypothetical protein
MICRRVRFTVRTMMIVVATTSLLIVLLIPASQRLIWLYKNPPVTLPLFDGGAAWVGAHSPKQIRPGYFPAGQPVETECVYGVRILPNVPSGLIYRGSVDVKLMDKRTNGTVFETQQKNFTLISGNGSLSSSKGRFTFSMTPPLPGSYFVRHELCATDLFGRKVMIACYTGAFQAL